MQSELKKQLINESSNQPTTLKPLQRQRVKIKSPKKKKKVHLSFQDELQQQPRDKILKNPTVKSSNILNKKIEQQKPIEEQLKQQFINKTQKIKQDLIEFEYSYWEGGEVIRKLRRKKKQKIKQLLEICRLQLVSAHNSLAHLSTSDLMFVIKDFIAPHQMTLSQIQSLELKTKKNDMLLNLRQAKIKRDGKQVNMSVNIDGPFRIIEKEKYQKGKTAFPFCNWETLKINI